MKKRFTRIVPHLWYDQEAVEAANHYCSFFPDSRVTHVMTLHDTPSGDCDVVSFEIAGQPFMAISAGPYVTFNPSISFIVGCDTAQEVDRLWENLSRGGEVLMELGAYPFSERYGWVQDRYGLSWQLILVKPEGEQRPRIVPSLLFTADTPGNAGDAIQFYLSVFKNAKQGALVRYGKEHPPNPPGSIMFADFMIENFWLAAMDSAVPHGFTFNEAISFMVSCDTQEEIDDYWEKLSAVPEAEQCGWLKDRFGVSWQIVPALLDEMLQNGRPEQVARVTEAFLKMKKFDIAALKQAYGAA